jgi:spore maturation protein CgeB
MRLLLIGSESEYAIERPYLRYLSKIEGIEYIDLFKAQNQFLDYYSANTLNKIVYRLGVSDILEKINETLIQKVNDCKPHAVLIFKGMEIFPSTLVWMKQAGIKLVNYNPDNPFLFSGRGSGNKNISNSISLYDLHFTYDADIKKQIEQKYQLPVEILPFGFDLSSQLFEQCARQQEVKKVCFLGSADVYRAKLLKQLAREGVQIDVYGNNWRDFLKTKNVQSHDAVYGDRFWETLWRYRVQLNLMRPHNPHSHNMRTFEVPGVGGIQLAPSTNDHATYFEPNDEIFLFTDLADCKNKILKLLELSAFEASKIRQAARARSLTSGYTYEARAQLVFNWIEKVVNG